MRNSLAPVAGLACLAMLAVGFLQPALASGHHSTSAVRAAASVSAGSAVQPAIAATAGKPHTVLKEIGSKDGGGEPSIAAAPDGTLYVSAPGNAMEFFRSQDGGTTWTKRASPEAPAGDTTVSVDSSGAVYESNLNVITGDQNTLQVDLFKSFDQGATWPQKATSTLGPTNATGQPLFVDRQWVDAWIPKGSDTAHAVVGLSYHDFGPSQIWESTSTDGGATFGVPVNVINDPLAEADSYCNTIPGGLKIVPSGEHAGRMYVAWLAADPANPVTGCNETQLAAFHSVWIARSDDRGATWTDQLVYDAGVLHDGSEIFADLTLDNKGNPYLAFTMNINSEFDVWVEGSFDGGTTWNGKSDGTGAPYQVNLDTGTHYFPTIAAGRPGEVDVAYLRTPTVVATTPYGKPEPGGDANATWYAWMGQSLNLASGHPTWTNVKLTKLPMHQGDICTLGIFCSAVPNSNRDILDFIDIVVDANGLAHVAYTDDKNYSGGELVAANQTGGPTVGRGGH